MPKRKKSDKKGKKILELSAFNSKRGRRKAKVGRKKIRQSKAVSVEEQTDLKPQPSAPQPDNEQEVNDNDLFFEGSLADKESLGSSPLKPATESPETHDAAELERIRRLHQAMEGSGVYLDLQTALKREKCRKRLQF